MPELPEKYKSRYEPITFAGCYKRGQQQVHIRKYLSSFGSANGKYRKAAYNDLKDFIMRRDRYADDDSGAVHDYWGGGWISTPLLNPIPWTWIDLEMLMPNFQGVGLPEDMARIMKVVDLYLHTVNFDKKTLGKLGWGKPMTSRQDYADFYIGLDCRGFAAAYLKENYPGVKLARGPSFVIDAYNKNSWGFHLKDRSGSFNRIDKPKDVTPGCLLVKCDNGNNRRHVAVVNSVGSADANGVMVTTAESAASKGGLCKKTSRLQRLIKNHDKDPNARHWKHHGEHYNFVLQPR